MARSSKVKLIFSGLSMSGVSSITSLFVTGCYRGAEIWYRPNEEWTRIQRNIKTLNLTLFDLSGEKSFLDKATTKLSPIIFKDTRILVFVLDLYDVKNLPQAKYYLDKEVACLERQNSEYSLYIFLNKIDQIPNKLKEEVVKTFKDHLNENSIIKDKARYYITSLYTGSIFIAFDELFWDILYSSSLNILLNEFKKEFWLLEDFEIQNLMKKIMVMESTANVPIYPIGNEIISFQDNMKELVEFNESIFLEYGEGSFVEKTSINQIKYSLYKSKSFQKIYTFLLLFELNEQTWNVVPIFDMLLENLIQKRFQGEEISVKRDFVDPLLPVLIQPSKFKIKPQQEEDFEKFSRFLDSHARTDFRNVGLKELLIRFAQDNVQDRAREEESISLASSAILEEKLPQRPTSPLERIVPTQGRSRNSKEKKAEISYQPNSSSENIIPLQASSSHSKEVYEDISLRKQEKPPGGRIKVPVPPQENVNSIPLKESDESDLLSLPLRDVLKILRDKE
ncbi:MAG: ADP-ribosylation factor-like protein [Candidatus Hodarchaeales archaeon]|jgi:hypothetical protein